MTASAGLDRDAVEDAIRDMIHRERDRVDDPGASIPGADPHDAHGWHANTDQRHPREPGLPIYQPDAWRFFRLLDVGWLGDDPLIGFAWDELGTPNLHYLTRTRFMASDLGRHPLTLALNVRMHLRYLLAPTDGSASATGSWRQRCPRLWLSADQVLVGPQAAVDQQRLDTGWELPWPSLTNPPWPDLSQDASPGVACGVPATSGSSTAGSKGQDRHAVHQLTGAHRAVTRAPDTRAR